MELEFRINKLNFITQSVYQMKLSTRKMQWEDIDLIADYWSEADEVYLQGMGVDTTIPFSKESFLQRMRDQFKLPIDKKNAFCVIWLLDDIPIGHNNTNPTIFGDSAYMHLHIWYAEHKGKGLGYQFLQKSIPEIMDSLELNTLFCQPYALNPGPNKTLEKLGFEFVEKKHMIPNEKSFEQDVCVWKLEKHQILSFI